MHILIVTQYFWPETFKVNDLVTGFKERGHEVTILTGKPNYPSGQFYEGYSFWNKTFDQYLNCKVIRVPLLPRGRGRSIHLFANFISFAVMASMMAPLLCRENYDIIFVYEPSPITVGFPAILMKKIVKKPLFFWVQDLWPESLSATGAIRSKRALAIVEYMVRYIYRNCDNILVQSEKFVDPIRSLRVPPNKINYFPNWAEGYYRPLDPSEVNAEVGSYPPGFKLVFAGNLGASQDLPTILKAAELLKAQANIKWVFIGDGRMKGWMEQEIAGRNLQETVFLLGKYPSEQMPQFFALADALLVTLKKSYIFSLTVPSKLQSYLACGKPIVAALDGEGNRILDEAEAGVSCPSENASELAEAVLRLYGKSQEEREEMGRRGRHYYEKHFEREILINKLEAWMNFESKEAVMK